MRDERRSHGGVEKLGTGDLTLEFFFSILETPLGYGRLSIRRHFAYYGLMENERFGLEIDKTRLSPSLSADTLRLNCKRP